MHPTQVIEVFGNVSTSFGTMARPSLNNQVQFYGDRPRETHPSGELNTRGVAEYSNVGPIERYISKTLQDRAKLVLITNRKLHMSFRLVPNSVTLDDLERRNGPNRRVIAPNSVAFEADYVKVAEDTPILSAAVMYVTESSFQRYITYGDTGRESPPARALK